MKNTHFVAAVVALLAATPAVAQISTTGTTNATTLANSLQGTGVTFTSATLTGAGDVGTFTGGLAGVGIANGVVLTTGGLSCVTATNDSGNCGVNKTFTSVRDSATLVLNFTATSSSLFFNYVFASEEYNTFSGSNFNDIFALRLNGTNYNNTNLATLPNGDVVSINTVNLGSNSTFYRNNTTEPGPNTLTGPLLGLPIQFDGLTTLLTASANNLVIGDTYSLTFDIADVGDNELDSAVFIQGGSVGIEAPPTSAVPEPASWAMMIFGFGMVGGAMRRRPNRMLAAA